MSDQPTPAQTAYAAYGAATDRLRRQLAELPELLAYAQLALLPGSAPQSGWVSGATREAPLPCRLDVLSLLGPAAEETVRDPYGDQVGVEPILGTLLSWARLVAEESNYYRPSGGWTVGGLVAFLADRDVFEWAVQRPWADEYADEIAAVHWQLVPLARLRPRRRPMSLPCPRCELLTLTAEDGRDIECSNPGCGTILRQSEYDDRAEQHLTELYAA